MAHGLNLSWSAPAGPDAAVSYNVYRGTTNGGPYTKIESAVTSLNFLDTTGAGGTEYFYVVTAVDANGIESTFSNQASGVFPEVPNAPTGLTVTVV